MIIGCGGAGKSTLAGELGEILALDAYHLDAPFWKHDWVRVSKDEPRCKIIEFLNKRARLLKIFMGEWELDD